LVKPEDQAREHIDQLLEAAGWSVQDRDKVNLSASLGIAVRYFQLKELCEADYLLFVDRKAVGVLEAKPAGNTLSGVEVQTENYLSLLPDDIPSYSNPLPFAYESTGVETQFRDGRDPEPRSRSLFAFHTPEELRDWLSEVDTLRGRLTELPPIEDPKLYQCQFAAIENLERSLELYKLRALIQMATGSGKTFTAISEVYRLIKYAGAKRILFLVDRKTLGKQTKREFEDYTTPDDGRKFTQLYNVQHLTSNVLDPVSRVCISTIQRLYSMLKGDEDLDEEHDEMSAWELISDNKQIQVAYNSRIPIGYFDFIITDECHRSIYNLWRQVLDYYDAFLIGLTATPSKQTLGFFNQNLVTEYSHERAVADGINVGYDVYRIKTEIGEEGSHVDAGVYVDRRDRLTRQKRWELLDNDLDYTKKQLDRDVVAPDQIRTVIQAFRDRALPEMFPDRTEVPKTLIFAKGDTHAEDIVGIVREEFGKGNEFCKKITYRTTGEKPEDLIASFRNSYNPRIAVTVDMISTGTDIKPLECLIFMRNIKSRTYFEQMKGRGTRIIKKDDLKAVTPDALAKTHFVIVDAVGVCESDKTDSRPLERKRTVPFEKLLNSIAFGNREDDVITSFAGRLARLQRSLDSEDYDKLTEAANGKQLSEVINGLLDSVNPDEQIEHAKVIGNTDQPTDEEIILAAEGLKNEACEPFDDPGYREAILEAKRKSEQIIDTVSQDHITFAGFDEGAKQKAETIAKNFEQFIQDNKDEITALQIIYNRPYGQQKLTTENIAELADALIRHPYNMNKEVLWQAYEKLEQSKVKGRGVARILTDLVSLVRFASNQEDILKPFSEYVNQRFGKWLEHQNELGVEFTDEQVKWLTMIKDHICTSASVSKDDFELAPFSQHGGLAKIYKLFGDDYEKIVDKLNEDLVA